VQQTFLFSPLTVTARAPVTKLAPQLLKVAVALNAGRRIAFPKTANAVRVTIGRRSAVVLKEDADTLAGAGLASEIEFGVVRNDSKGHPLRETFKALASPAPKAIKSSQSSATSRRHFIDQGLMLALSADPAGFQ
jgi:hypothetical protein